jgi:hypothetical protein
MRGGEVEYRRNTMVSHVANLSPGTFHVASELGHASFDPGYSRLDRCDCVS